jgi:hypothetical protein
LAIAEAFLLASVKRAVEKIASLGIDKAVELIQLSSKQKAFNQAVSRIRLIENVKTLWQIDKEISIYDFFVPPKAVYLTSQLELTDYSKLPNSKNLVIEGILGQGKSILMRHLAMSCMKDGLIPIFISAHTITPKKTLKEKIREYFCDFSKRTVSDEEVEKLLDSQFFVLFLDGFDEAPPTEEGALIEEVRSICRRHEDALRVIVSSRPDNAIQKCEEFHVVKLNELDADKRNQLIRKLYSAAQAAELIDALGRAGTGSAKDLLKTPLMVVILLIVYNAERRVPESFAEFFEHLFEFFLVRHDATKPGFSRSRETKIANSEFRQLFEAFCFVTRKDRLHTAISVREAEQAIKIAANTVNVSVDTTAYVNDIKKVTCLLIEEGLKLHFVHQAIQYFFSAQFIRSCPEEDLKLFYADLSKDDNWVEWVPELSYLRRIDTYNFYTLFYNDGLQRRSYFRESRDLTDEEIVEIASNLTFERLGNEVVIRIRATSFMSMAERDFLADFFVRSLLQEVLSSALRASSQDSAVFLDENSQVDLTGNQMEVIKRAANNAALQFRQKLTEANQVQSVRAKRSALLRRE